MSSKTEVSDVDTDFIHNYHGHVGSFKLLHTFWGQKLPIKKKGSSKMMDRLFVLTQLRLLIVKARTFRGKRSLEKELMWTGLRNIRMYYPKNCCEIKMIFDGEDELVVISNVKEDGEKFLNAVCQVVEIFKQVIPFYRDPVISIPEDIEYVSRVSFVLNKEEHVRFCYKLHCAHGKVDWQEVICNNLTDAVQSGSSIFKPFDVIAEASDPKNDINVVLNSISSTDCFTSIFVKNSSIRNETLQEIGRLVSINSNIIDIHFHNCHLTKDSVCHFTNQFKKPEHYTFRPPIRSLHLEKNPLVNIGDCLEPLGIVGVECLILSDCKLAKKSIRKGLIPLLMNNCWLAEGGLRILDLSFNDLGKKGSLELVPFLRSTGCLEELGLDATGSELTQILRTIRKNEVCAMNKLQYLNISRNEMKPFGAVALAEILEESHSIRAVHLCEMNLDQSSFEHIINKVARNKTGAEIEIDVSSNKLSMWAGDAFKSVNGLGDALVSFSMAKNSLGECEDFDSIMTCLSSARNLRSLNLDLNFKSNKKLLHLHKMEALAKCVENLSNIEMLSIAGNKPALRLALSGQELVPIVKLIASKRSLKVLNISGNRLLDGGAKALSDSLMVNTTLRRVDFDYNKLTFENMRTIIGGIQQSSGLYGALPKHNLKRLWGEKKKNREVIQAWKDRLTKIFKANEERGKQEVEEKTDAPPLTVIPGYDGYYPPLDSAPIRRIPTLVRKRAPHSRGTSGGSILDDNLVLTEINSNCLTLEDNYSSITPGRSESDASCEWIGKGQPCNSEHEDNPHEVMRGQKETPSFVEEYKEDLGERTRPSHKTLGDSLVVPLLLKNASNAVQSECESTEGEICRNTQYKNACSDDVIVMNSAKVQTNCKFSNCPSSSPELISRKEEEGKVLPASFQLTNQIPGKIKHVELSRRVRRPLTPNNTTRRQRSPSPNPVLVHPKHFTSTKHAPGRPKRKPRKSKGQMMSKVAQFENMKVMGVQRKPKRRVLKLDPCLMSMPLPGSGVPSGLRIRHKASKIESPISNKKIDVSFMIANRPLISGGKSGRRRRKTTKTKRRR